MDKKKSSGKKNVVGGFSNISPRKSGMGLPGKARQNERMRVFERLKGQIDIDKL